MNPRQWFRVSGSVASAILFVAGLLLVATVPAQAQGAYTVPGTTAIGATNGPLSVTVTITTPGKLKTITVLTQGATGLDYGFAGGTCAAGATYAAGDTCTVKFSFTPTHPWVRYGGISLFDGSNNLLGNSFLTGIGTGPQVSYPLGAATVPSLLGSGFSSPQGIAVDGSGNVYVADTANSLVKELMAADGTIVTLGSGFSSPSGIAVDGSGNVYVADTGNNLVKELIAVGGVVPASPASATIVTLGSGYSSPTGVAVDGSGNVYVADRDNSAVEELAAVGGVIPSGATPTTLGSGFSSPTGVAVDGNGNVYVADSGHGAVKEIVAAGGVIPSGATPVTLSSGFLLPSGVAIDGSGNLYVADTGNNAVKEIVAVGGAIPASPSILTLATGFSSPSGVAVDASGNLYVADSGNSKAKEMNAQNPPTLAFASTAVGATSSAQTVTVANNGNLPLVFAIPATGNNPSVTANFSLSAGPTPCAVSLAAGASCTDVVSFAPTQAGSLTGFLVTTDNNLNVAGSTQSTNLSGTATPGTPIVTVSPTSVVVDTPSVLLTATVSYGGVAPPPVPTFTVNAGSPVTASCSGSSSPLTCTATYPLPSLPVTAGCYTIAANLASNSNYTVASGTGTLCVTQGTPTLTLSTSGSPSTVNDPVTFTVAVTPNTGITPTGNVSFSATLNGVTTPITSCIPVSPGPTFTVACPTSALLASSNAITASIAGDTNFIPATSNTVIQNVTPAAATLTLSTSGSPSIVNGSVTFTATLSGAPFSPTAPSGKVDFTVGGLAINGIGGPCTGVPIGPTTQTATCITTALLAGADSIAASYGSDPNFTAIPATLTQPVNPAAATLTLTTSGSPSIVNGSVTFTATLSGAPFSPTAPSGKVDFTVGGVAISGIGGACTGVPIVPIGSTQTATCITTALLAGADSIAATYRSDPNFTVATPGTTTQQVTKAVTTLAISPPVSATVDASVTFTATLSSTAGFTPTLPGGTVNFTANGVAINGISGPCTGVSLSLATPATPTATCTTSSLTAPADVIGASYSGDPNFVTSAAPAVTQIIVKGTPSITIGSSQPTAIVNQTVTFTATIAPSGASASGVPPTGSVTFRQGSAVGPIVCGPVIVTGSVPADGTGTASCSTAFTNTFSGTGIYAVYLGDSNFNAPVTPPNVPQTVNPAPTLTTVTSNLSTVGVSQSVNLTVTVAPANSVSPTYQGNALPKSGSVSLSDSLAPGASVCPIATQSISPTGLTYTCTTPYILTSLGSHIITATYTSGDPNFNGGSSTPAQSATVNVTTSGIALAVSQTAGPAAPTVNQIVTFSAAITPFPTGLTTSPGTLITYSDSLGGAIPGCSSLPVTDSAAIPSCKETFSSAGSHTITVAFTPGPGSSLGPLTSSFGPVTVTQTATTAVFTSPTVFTSTTDQTVTFSATVTPAVVGPTPPGGNVKFAYVLSGATTTICTVPVSTTAGVTSASCTAPLPAAGSYAVTAGYLGDSNFTPPASTPSFTQTVSKTVLTLAATPPSAQVDGSTPFTATVTLPSSINDTASGDAVPAGSITFTPDVGTPCSAAVATTGSNIGQASCSLTLATAGSHTITVSYGSDPNFSAVSILENLAVTPTVLTLAATPPSPQLGISTLFTATASLPASITDTAPGDKTPVGSITFTPDNNGTPCTAAVAASGQASCSLTLATAGDHTITVSYGSDPNFSAVNIPDKVNVPKAIPTITVTSSSPTSVATQPVTFTATVTFSPQATAANLPTGLPVSFAVAQGTCAPVTQTLVGSTYTDSCLVTFPSSVSGPLTVTATYSGDSNYASASASLTQTVQNFTLTNTAPLTISQGNTNLTDAYTSQPIALTVNFTDPAVFVCSVTPTPAVGVISCTATGTTGVTINSGSSITPGSYSVQLAATSSVTPGSYPVQYTVSDTKVSGMSQSATTSLTIVNQAPSVFVASVGTVTATITVPPGQTPVSCATQVATFQKATSSYLVNTTLSNIGIQCTNFKLVAGTTNGYTFTITAGNPTVARLETGNGGLFLAGLGVPFLLMLGFFPASRKLRKALLHSLAILGLGLLLMQATGCSSGGFTKTGGSGPALAGNYLIDVVNAPAGTANPGPPVAEVPLVVGN